MTPQKIFDKVAKHLFTQGKRAMLDPTRESGQCMYRGPDGSKCAVGVLIPNKLYRKGMEMRTIIGLLDDEEVVLPAWMAENRELLWALQCVHDQHEAWGSSMTMRLKLRTEAVAHGLDDAILDSLLFAWEDKVGEQV
jgi:hypothetical protein